MLSVVLLVAQIASVLSAPHIQGYRHDPYAVEEHNSTCDKDHDNSKDVYDQRQNGTENYRINVKDVVVLLAPAETILAAANFPNFEGELGSFKPPKPTTVKPVGLESVSESVLPGGCEGGKCDTGNQNSVRPGAANQGAATHGSTGHGTSTLSNAGQGTATHANVNQGTGTTGTASQGAGTHSNTNQGAGTHSNTNQGAGTHSNTNQGAGTHSNTNQGAGTHSTAGHGSATPSVRQRGKLKMMNNLIRLFRNLKDETLPITN